MSIAVLDYGIGNLRSAQKALIHLGADARLTADRDEIAAAAGVVLPGVGAFGACMDALTACGLADVAAAAATDGRPFLGVCIGMHLLYEGSDEAPGCAGLGVLTGRVERLPSTVTLPQMGWNTLDVRPSSQLLAGLETPIWMYFVHSYAALDTDSPDVAATTEYGTAFVAAVEQNSLWATQFHPEKSSRFGLMALRNFVACCS